MSMRIGCRAAGISILVTIACAATPHAPKAEGRQPSVPSQIGGAEKATSATPAASPASPTEKALNEWAASIKPDLEAFAGARFEKDVAILEAPLPKAGANKDHALEMRLTLRKEEKKP